MKVRQATVTDLPKISELGKGFYDQTRHSEHVEYDPENSQLLVRTIIASGGCFVATTDADEIVGICAGMLYPLWMSPAHITGQELFWYVHPEHRKSRAGKLLFEALENWAKESGAHSFCMVALSHLHENRVGQMYESKGYVPLEKSYIKVF